METGARPFLLKPAAKDYLWGGNRLNEIFSKNIAISPLAETWECSTHPDGPSIVAGGEYEGMLLSQVIHAHPEYLGTRPDRTAQGLPVLVKLIDAKSNLSVQVHPSDEYASARENGQLGKTELWYVLEASPGAELIYGLNQDTDTQLLRRSIADGTVEKYLRHVPVHRDDAFFVPAGTIHAIGAGVLIAEVQESSNLTYRLYDYRRVDQQGNARALHIDKALEVADLSGSPVRKLPVHELECRQGYAAEWLCRCEHFQVCRMRINTELRRDIVSYAADCASFHALLCIAGCGCVVTAGNETIHFFRGDCIFVPANSESKLYGNAQFLDIMR